MNRRLAALLATSFTSHLALQMIAVAIGWQVYAATHRPLALGLVGLVQLAPALAVAIPAGHLADRLDRARLVTTTQLGLALAASGLFAVGSIRPSHIPLLYIALAALGAARAFADPVLQALLPSLVPERELGRALTWSSASWQLAGVAGPLIGGRLYDAGGGHVVYAVAVGLFVQAALIATSIGGDGAPTAPSAEREPTKADLLAGLRFVRGEPMLLGAWSLDLFAVLFGGATALLPIFASDVLHASATALGLLRAAPGIGAALATVVLARRPLQRHAGSVLLACVGAFGIATLAFGLSQSLALSVAALVVAGAADMVSVVLRGILTPLRTPPHLRGRVGAVHGVFVSMSGELGELESGLTAAWWGAVPAVVVGGCGTLVAVAVCALACPSLRRWDRLAPSN